MFDEVAFLGGYTGEDFALLVESIYVWVCRCCPPRLPPPVTRMYGRIHGMVVQNVIQAFVCFQNIEKLSTRYMR